MTFTQKVLEGLDADAVHEAYVAFREHEAGGEPFDELCFALSIKRYFASAAKRAAYERRQRAEALREACIEARRRTRIHMEDRP